MKSKKPQGRPFVKPALRKSVQIPCRVTPSEKVMIRTFLAQEGLTVRQIVLERMEGK